MVTCSDCNQEVTEYHKGRKCRDCVLRVRREGMHRARLENPYKFRNRQNNYYRKKILELHSLYGNKCENCGCDVQEILEVNHIYGGGKIDSRKKGVNKLSRCKDILNGKRPKEDYNLLCKLCNTLHYIHDLKEIKGHTVTWQKLK